MLHTGSVQVHRMQKRLMMMMCVCDVDAADVGQQLEMRNEV